MENENNIIASLTAAIESSPEDTSLYIQRGKACLKENNFGGALNDFNAVIRLQPDNVEAEQYISMITEILDYRCTDLLNP